MRLLVAAVALLLLLGGCERKSEAPKREVIVDDARVFADHQELLRQYLAFNDYLLRTYDIDFRVVTTNSTEDVDLLAHEMFQKLLAKSESKSGRAVLLLFAPAQDKVRLEVSQALEPIYTDAFISYIERKGVVPYFRDRKLARGLYMATELVYDRAVEADAGLEWTPPMETKSGGGGAKVAANIGKKGPKKSFPDVEAPKGASPKEVLQIYLDEVLKKHNMRSDLSIYTPATRRFFEGHTLTSINQDNEVRFLAPCVPKAKEFIDERNGYAVVGVTPYDEHRTCSPYFFKKIDGRWLLDIANMAPRISFNVKMEWHFYPTEKRLEGEGIYYAFAFDGYFYNRYGFPHKSKTKKPKDVRWGFSCKPWGDEEQIKKDYKRYGHCYINYIYPGSPAQSRLGLRPGDFIYGVGDEGDLAHPVKYGRFMEYMASVPKWEVATVWVRRQNKGPLVQLRGVAP